MASAREIQTRMKSIADTRKITNAMYMISSTKLRKAQRELADTEPYFYALQGMIARILRHIPPDVHSAYFDRRKRKTGGERKRGLIVVTGDKGFAGAYNHNVLKLAGEWLEKEGDNRLFVVGELGRNYFLSRGMAVDTQFHYTAQNPTMDRARTIATTVVGRFLRQELDEVYLAFTQMENSLSETARMVRLLPLEREDFSSRLPADVYREEFFMEPSPKEVLDQIIPNYIGGYIYGALVEAFCSEQHARMSAMQTATKSADDMLAQLAVAYNRIRQAAITQEITEVSSGAKAQKRKKQSGCGKRPVQQGCEGKERKVCAAGYGGKS